MNFCHQYVMGKKRRIYSIDGFQAYFLCARRELTTLLFFQMVVDCRAHFKLSRVFVFLLQSFLFIRLTKTVDMSGQLMKIDRVTRWKSRTNEKKSKKNIRQKSPKKLFFFVQFSLICMYYTCITHVSIMKSSDSDDIIISLPIIVVVYCVASHHFNERHSISFHGNDERNTFFNQPMPMKGRLRKKQLIIRKVYI